MTHLYWIPLAAVIGFLVPFIFGNNKNLPVDAYYLIYFTVVGLFFAFYIKQTNFDYKYFLSHHLVLGLVFGLVFALILARNVFSRPETAKLAGDVLLWAIFWRGIVYGAIDGLLLSVFPWIVTWRAFDVGDRPLVEKNCI